MLTMMFVYKLEVIFRVLVCNQDLVAIIIGVDWHQSKSVSLNKITQSLAKYFNLKITKS